MDQKLTKEERLYGKKQIEMLFSKGRTFFIYPFRVFYVVENEATEPSAKLLITVSKKIFKKAVERNRIKRLIREGYRLNKSKLAEHLNAHNKSINFGLVYIGETIINYQEIERKLILILQRLIEQDEEHIG